MASAFAPPTQPRSPTSINSRRSSNSKCSNVIEKVPVRWRTSLYSRRKQVTREDSPEVKSSGLGKNSNAALHMQVAQRCKIGLKLARAMVRFPTVANFGSMSLRVNTCW